MRVASLPEATAADAVSVLRADPIVVRVERDRERQAEATPSDTRYDDQWSLPRIGWDQAFGSVDPAGSAVVAVLDTGVDGSHPDIDGRLVEGISQIVGQSPTSDPNGHGTWMAGIVAAETDNGAGIAGVGYNGVRIMPVTVLGADGTGQDSDIIEGVVWATSNGADVILMAFSNPGASASLQAAVDYAWATAWSSSRPWPTTAPAPTATPPVTRASSVSPRPTAAMPSPARPTTATACSSRPPAWISSPCRPAERHHHHRWHLCRRGTCRGRSCTAQGQERQSLERRDRGTPRCDRRSGRLIDRDRQRPHQPVSRPDHARHGLRQAAGRPRRWPVRRSVCGAGAGELPALG